jgi:sugar phosphate isomerase/epimerase
MKTLKLALLATIISAPGLAFVLFGLAGCESDRSAAPGTTADFHDHLGLQLWSLRAQTTQSTTGALDLAKGYGITEIETAGTGSLTTEQFARELKSRGLNAVSAHLGYDLLTKDLNGTIATAKTLGVKFLICPSLPHGKEGFTEADAHRVAAEFNTFGAACKAAGLRFGYHPHGFEFTPTSAGKGEVVFDILVRETKPDLVCYEMDVFWVFHAGQDPAKLLAKYPNRWVMLHVKDMRKGAPTGFSTGSAPATDDVAVGEGQIDWPSVLRTAQKIGVQHYFIEDETPAPLENIPASLKYLRALKL